jgi:hypothetical protein
MSVSFHHHRTGWFMSVTAPVPREMASCPAAVNVNPNIRGDLLQNGY